MNKRYSIIPFLLLLFACGKDDPTDPGGPGQPTGKNGVYILNEGNFQWGNASVDFYDHESKNLTENIFQKANNRQLGDIGQSVTRQNDKFFIVVNNSGKIEVVDAGDFTSLATIAGMPSPRYMSVIDDQKAYVTDFKADGVHILDLEQMKVTGKIAVKDWTEGILYAGGNVFVTNRNRDYGNTSIPSRENIYVIDPATDRIVDSLNAGVGCNDLQLDSDGFVWVLCSGNGIDKAGKLLRFDPGSLDIIASLDFNTPIESPFRLRISGNRENLYFINDDIYRMGIDDAAFPATPLIHREGRNFYALGIDPVTEEIFVADAIDYVQPGTIYRYSSSGTVIDSFKGGMIPGEFHFGF